ncbi:RAMP superfamily CRISPR-associated protein [Desulfurispora thermophila]|uniref:RAMP superfamily CRISPR-associated protein n=1 Tax=Desulfurispora thermophila TaxID=265470 RepID=UPI000367509E|nr:RAMP superfamily CRISPR-associated protein [Desulfurispora thermophila]
MEWRVDVELKSPLLVGGQKTGSDYMRSLPYIPGGVLRASLARWIVEQCPLNRVGNRLFWVEFRDEMACTDCAAHFWCRHFTRLLFTFCYPYGARPWPVTAVQCKFDSGHPAQDALVHRLLAGRGQAEGPPVCAHCPGGKGRVESVSGFYVEDGGVYRSVQPVYRPLTRLGVDPYRRVARDGLLYTVNVLSEVSRQNGREQPAVFSGRVRLLEQAVSPAPATWQCTLRLGAKTTSGLGQVLVSWQLLPTRPERGQKRIARGVKAFTALLPESWRRAGRVYVPLLLLSDACWPQMPPSEHLTDEGWRKFWQQSLQEALPGEGAGWQELGWQLEEALVSTGYRSGFDTSAPGGAWKEYAFLVQRGSILVLSLPGEALDRALPLLCSLEWLGLGQRREEGYGQVSVADEIHWRCGKSG